MGMNTNSPGLIYRRQGLKEDMKKKKTDGRKKKGNNWSDETRATREEEAQED